MLEGYIDVDQCGAHEALLEVLGWGRADVLETPVTRSYLAQQSVKPWYQRAQFAH